MMRIVHKECNSSICQNSLQVRHRSVSVSTIYGAETIPYCVNVCLALVVCSVISISIDSRLHKTDQQGLGSVFIIVVRAHHQSTIMLPSEITIIESFRST